MTVMRLLSLGLLAILATIGLGDSRPPASRETPIGFVGPVADHCGPGRHVCASCGVRG